MSGDAPRAWLGVACRDHALAGREGGFAQLGHGKHTAVKVLRRGDWIVYYSPSTEMGGGDKVQAFTTIGRVTSDAPYQVRQSEGFEPFRVDVDHLTDAVEAPIRPLLDDLDLTRGLGSKWGMAVRGAKAKLSADDLGRIAAAMGVEGKVLE